MNHLMRWLLTAALLLACDPGICQRASPTPIVAVPTITARPDDPMIDSLRRALSERGYVDGQNIRIEARSASGDMARLGQVIEQLVELKPAVILAALGPIVEAAEKATHTIPIVMVGWDHDPVAAGYVKALSRPEGNITGIYLRADESVGKRFELIKDLVPGIANVAVLTDAFSHRQFSVATEAARSLGIKTHAVSVDNDDFESALKALRGRKVGAVVVLQSPRFYVNRARIAKAAQAAHLPTVFQDESYVAQGGLISYGPDILNAWARVAYFVDRILNGASARDLPIEQPLTYRLVINLATARHLGLSIPEPVLLRADAVIR